MTPKPSGDWMQEAQKRQGKVVLGTAALWWSPWQSYACATVCINWDKQIHGNLIHLGLLNTTYGLLIPSAHKESQDHLEWESSPRPWSQSCNQSPPCPQPRELNAMSRSSLGTSRTGTPNLPRQPLPVPDHPVSEEIDSVGSVLGMHQFLLAVLLPLPWAFLSKDTVSFGMGVWLTKASVLIFKAEICSLENYSDIH